MDACGQHLIVFIYDFLVVANSSGECKLIADELVDPAPQSPWVHQYQMFMQFIDPRQCIISIVIVIDFVDMCLRAPDCNLRALKPVSKLSCLATLIRGG